MEKDQSPFNDVAKQALTEYDLQNHTLTFIQHSDNVTFKVEGPGLDAYLLRLHIPVTSAMGTHGADPGAVTSELQWLEALSQDTDLILQKPVRNRTGLLVTQVAVDNADMPVNCTLLRWLEGQPYHRDLETPQTARQIGEILAKLHIHAEQWGTPEGFERPARDIEYFQRVLNNIQPALNDGRISPSDYSEFETSVALMIENLRSLDVSRQTHGIMHSDTHKGNMLHHDGAIRLIDFSFSSFGNFMFDLSVSFSDMKPELRGAFLDGYQRLRNLPDDHESLVEGFFVGGMVGTFSYWVDNPNAQDRLKTLAPEIARDYAARFNRGERFWFS
ncbi:MAG: phosphotransferase [SAR202 cluster bacterium]|nr:phosphotransferase [SAR202 cluster bacterium]